MEWTATASHEPAFDRSTLERWATCPRQAHLISSGKYNTSSHPANSGTEAHKAYSVAIEFYLKSSGSCEVRSIVDILVDAALSARPDVQPDVLKAIKQSAWTWAHMLCSVKDKCILKHEGGQGNLSGQISSEVSGAVVTAELDFLYAGSSVETVRLMDWKTGWKPWDSEMVQNSFQFQCYSWLVMENYPGIEEVVVSIWVSRLNTFTKPITFSRSNMDQYSRRIVSSIESARSLDKPAWPSKEKCTICECAMDCPDAGEQVHAIHKAPGEYIDKMQRYAAAVEDMKKTAAKYTDEFGDIKSANGICFGRNKPKSYRKPTADLY